MSASKQLVISVVLRLLAAGLIAITVIGITLFASVMYMVW
jgi:hypothetical protein